MVKRLDSGLYAEVDRVMLINGVNTMLKVVKELLLSQESPEDKYKRLKLDDGKDGEDQNAWEACRVMEIWNWWSVFFFGPFYILLLVTCMWCSYILLAGL